MGKNVLVTNHSNELNVIVNQLNFVEIDFDDELCALIILSSIPYNWDSIIIVVNNSFRLRSLMFYEIDNLILSEDPCKRKSCELVPPVLVSESGGRNSARVSKGNTNLNIHS